jgi:site-specific recombinase XerD
MTQEECGTLPQVVLDALAWLPNGDQLPRHREYLMTREKRFAPAMRKIEADGLRPEALAELWLWLAHLVFDRASPPGTTCASYAKTTGRFLLWCARNGYDHRTVRMQEFDRWVRWLAIECRNSATWRKRQIQSLRSFYDWRRSRGIAATNLAADLQAPKPKIKPARKYTDDQLRALFRAIGQSTELRQVRDKCAVLLLLATGLRREELGNLQMHQLELTARRGVVRVMGKGAKERDIPFEGPVVDALHAWLNKRDGLPYDCDPNAVFISTFGQTQGQALTVRGFEEMVSIHARAAGLREWGIHRFRVTFATQLYDDGADIETIRHLMGHESIETTRRYLAVSERARRTRLSANRQHRVLGTKPTGAPLWVRLATGGMDSD